MKRFFIILLAVLLLTGCASQTPGDTVPSTTLPSATPPVTEAATQTIPQETQPPVVTADALVDGVYEITVDSSSSMFRVVRCTLTVEKGTMTAAMTMSGQGYGMVYLGKRTEAAQASQDQLIPFTTGEQGEKIFTVPVEALNQPVDCAAFSIRKDTWYDRELVFESAQLPPQAYVGA